MFFLIRLDVHRNTDLFSDIIVAVRRMIIDIELPVIAVTQSIGDNLCRRIVLCDTPPGTVNNAAAKIQAG